MIVDKLMPKEQEFFLYENWVMFFFTEIYWLNGAFENLSIFFNNIRDK